MKAQPNILIILADELRADALGCFGNSVIKTPNIDRLASKGVRFEQCMITQPTCTPCRASLLTGCFPSALRTRMVGCHTPDDQRFLPRVLVESGYNTASIGKIHLVPQAVEQDKVNETFKDDGSYDYYGFQHIDLVDGHGDYCFGENYTRWLQEQVPDLEEKRKQSTPLCALSNCYTWSLPPDVHSSKYIADRSVEYLQEATEQDAPFFLHCSFPDPHYPFTVPEPYASMYKPEDMPEPSSPITESTNPPQIGVKAYNTRNHFHQDGELVRRVLGTPPHPYDTYTEKDWQTVRAITAGMITLLDDSIGRILDTLESTGLAKNTIVVFAADHGDYLGDYGFFGKGLHYDCILRTPLLMSGPGLPIGKEVDQMASLVDVTPTLLDLVGITEPEAMQGLSMKASLDGNENWPRDASLTENDDDMAAMRLRTLTTKDWKLSFYAGSDFGELYNRKNDPQERMNLWDDPEHSKIQSQLITRLADHIFCAIDGSNGRVQKPKTPIIKHTPHKMF